MKWWKGKWNETIPLSITESKEPFWKGLISRTSIWKSANRWCNEYTSKQIKGEKTLRQTVHFVIHFSWGVLEYFFCIASITTEDISIFTTSSYPSFTIPSLNAAHQLKLSKQQVYKVTHSFNGWWRLWTDLNCRIQLWGFGCGEGCRDWWEVPKKGTSDTNQKALFH